MTKRISLENRLAQAECSGVLLTARNRNDARLLRRRLLNHELIAPIPHAYTTDAIWSRTPKVQRMRVIIRTVAIQHPTWVFCSMTAAFILGLTDSYSYHRQVHVITAWRVHGARLPHIRIHSICSGPPEVVEHDGIRTTCVERVLMDCARDLNFRDALPIWDKALRCGMTTIEKIKTFLGENPRRYGTRAARLLIEQADSRAENGGESAARAAMLLSDYQVPELQVSFVSPDTRREIRPDFLWRTSDGRTIAGELDGMVKYHDEAMLQGRSMEETIMQEKDRETALNALGILVVRFKMEDIYNNELQRKLDMMNIPKVQGHEAFVRGRLRKLRGRRFGGQRLVNAITVVAPDKNDLTANHAETTVSTREL